MNYANTEPTRLAHAALLNFHGQLLRRDSLVQPYANLLENTIGCKLSETIVCTGEHVSPFNFKELASFSFPDLLAQAASSVIPCDIVVLAASLIHLDNGYYPRGFLTQTNVGDKIAVNLFSKRFNRYSPLVVPPAAFRPDDAAHVYLLAQFPWLAANKLYISYAHQLCDFMERIAGRWKLGDNRGHYRVLPLESVASQLLTLLIVERDPAIGRLLFDSTQRARLIDALTDVTCCWSSIQGTVLFWHNLSGKAKRLDLVDGALVNEHISIPVTPDELLRALKTSLILPGIFLAMVCVSILPGIPVCGGPRQDDYLPKMARAVCDILNWDVPSRLSVPGYLRFTGSSFPDSLDESLQPIPDVGTGLYLAENDIDVEWTYSRLRQPNTDAIDC